MKFWSSPRPKLSVNTSEPTEPPLDGFFDELASISQQANQKSEEDFPWVQWKCPECEGQWFCYGYSREFVPSHCTYCGIKFAMPSEDELAKANFRDERKQ